MTIFVNPRHKTSESSKANIQFCALVVAILAGCLTNSAACQERLKDFAPPDFYIGGALHGDSASFRSTEYRNVAVTEFNAVTATIYMGWGAWRTKARKPNVARLTRVIDWATERSLKVHGHSLVYPMSNASLGWWEQLPDDQVANYLEQFISKAAGDHAGRIWVWDVVNEVMADSGEPMDGHGLRTKYKEYRAIGPEYVELAFRAAKRADPSALLIINDYSIAEWNKKSTRLFEFVKQLKEKGVPIDGVGFQAHFTDLNQDQLNVESVRKNFKRFADAGFKLFITEMDVCSIATKSPNRRNPGVSTPDDRQQQRQATFFAGMLKIALEQPACRAFFLWDYADDFSWLHKTDRQIGELEPGTYTHPTPFWCGRHCPIQRKPAFYSMLEALKNTKAPKRK